MIVACPSCHTKYQLNPAKVVGDWAPLICRHCATRFNAVVEERLQRIPAEGVVLMAAPPSSPVRDPLVKALREQGLAVKVVEQAAATSHYLGLCAPDIFLTTPFLSDGSAQKPCEQIHRDIHLKGCAIVLLGTHQSDETQRVQFFADFILNTEQPFESVLRDFAVFLKHFRASQQQHGQFLSELRRAERLARTILSDIILYNPEEVEKGIVEGTFNDLLSEELEDARKYYAEQVHPDVLRETDILEDLLKKFMVEQRQKHSVGLTGHSAQSANAESHS